MHSLYLLRTRLSDYIFDIICFSTPTHVHVHTYTNCHRAANCLCVLKIDSNNCCCSKQMHCMKNTRTIISWENVRKFRMVNWNKQHSNQLNYAINKNVSSNNWVEKLLPNFLWSKMNEIILEIVWIRIKMNEKISSQFRGTFRPNCVIKVVWKWSVRWILFLNWGQHFLIEEEKR